MSGKEKCALALFAAYAKHTGAHFDEATEQRLLSRFGNDGHAAAVYARAGSRYLEAVADKALLDGNVHPATAKALATVEKFGIPLHGLYSYVMKPSEIMGRDVPDYIGKLYERHLQDHGSQSEHIWRANEAKELKSLKERTLGAVSPIYRDYVEKYFDKHIQGGQLYGKSNPTNPWAKLGRNAVGNLVNWNPLITTLNAFEFTPKALAYAVERQGVQGISTVLHALGDYWGTTGGKFWARIPELDKVGVYGLAHQGQGIAGSGLHSLMDVTENPLRGASYILGERIAPGMGRDALEKIAFVSRFGDEPMAFMDAQGTDVLALMRYAFSSNRMYLHMVNESRKGNVKALGALAAFSAMAVIQTGTSSAIPLPGPLYDAMPDDLKQAISDFDKKVPIANLAQKFLGTDLSASTRPLSAPALGAGLAMATTDIKGAFTHAGKAASAVSEGEYGDAVSHAVQSFFSGAQVAKVPGINLTTKRIVDSLAGVLSDDLTIDEVPEDIMKRTRLYQEPKYD